MSSNGFGSPNDGALEPTPAKGWRRWLRSWRSSGPTPVPSVCEICRSWGYSRLCTPCVQRFSAHQPRCETCALPLGLASKVCGECLADPPPFASTTCAVDYAFPWDRLIVQFKFHQQPELAKPLAQLLQTAIQARAQPRPQALVPVPLSNPRLAQRGYNQAWELASRLGNDLALPAWPALLQRTQDTAHQVDLSRAQRQRNLRSAFMVDAAQRPRVQGLHLALVDDVMTTGATLREASAELLRAGAQRVDIWVLARTSNQRHSTEAAEKS
jgi:ComF family protein